MPEFPPRLSRRLFLAQATAALATVAAVPLARAQPAPAPPPAPSTKSRQVAVTIDDGPATGGSRELEPFLRIADALRETFVAEKVPAIMFVNERQLHVDGQRDARIAVVQRWLDAGLDLGNHTYSHPNLTEVPLIRFLDDIVKGETISRPLLESRGQRLVWFRYPFLASATGETARTVEEFLAARAYRIAPVTVDYHDYRFSGIYARHLRANNPPAADEQLTAMLAALEVSFARAEKRSQEILGYELPQTLLIHCNELNARTLRTSLQRMRDRGYRFVSLDAAMEDPAYQTPLQPGALGGGGFFNALAAARRNATAPRS